MTIAIARLIVRARLMKMRDEWGQDAATNMELAIQALIDDAVKHAVKVSK